MTATADHSAKFWLTVLTDLKQRGVEDLLITYVDGLKGFDTAIASVFPATTVQLCIVHQLRNSFRFVPDKLLKELANDLKTVFQAPNREQVGRPVALRKLVSSSGKMGTSLSQSGPSVVGEMETTLAGFRLSNCYTQGDVYQKHGRGLSPSVTQSD